MNDKERKMLRRKPPKTTEAYYMDGEIVSKYYAYSLSLFDPDRKIGKRPAHLPVNRRGFST